MKVCYFGTFEEDYPRNITFIEALKKVGVDVMVCHASIKADKSSLGKVTYLPKLFLSYIRVYFFLVLKALSLQCDAVIIGYPAHLDVLIFYRIFKLKGIPLFFNPLVSLYDTFVYDRMTFKEGSMLAKLIFFIDKLAFSLPEKVFIDTNAHRDFLSELFGVSKERFTVIPVGALEPFFTDEEVEKAEYFQILYCGKYIPLHSVETIVKAANLLKTEKEIKFKLIGTGQEYRKIRKIVADEHIDNIEFIEWMNPEELAKEIKRSHIVLGIFKREGKASRVVPNKVYDALAAGAVVVTEDSDAVREFFQDGEQLFLVEPENPKKLAEKIKWIKDNYQLAQKTAKNGYDAVRRFASLENIGELIKKELQKG
ncbi:MAG: hypothetical protein OHK0040_03010 [bacterium]